MTVSKQHENGPEIEDNVGYICLLFCMYFRSKITLINFVCLNKYACIISDFEEK